MPLSTERSPRKKPLRASHPQIPNTRGVLHVLRALLGGADPTAEGAGAARTRRDAERERERERGAQWPSIHGDLTCYGTGAQSWGWRGEKAAGDPRVLSSPRGRVRFQHGGKMPRGPGAWDPRARAQAENVPNFLGRGVRGVCGAEGGV